MIWNSSLLMVSQIQTFNVTQNPSAANSSSGKLEHKQLYLYGSICMIFTLVLSPWGFDNDSLLYSLAPVCQWECKSGLGNPFWRQTKSPISLVTGLQNASLSRSCWLMIHSWCHSCCEIFSVLGIEALKNANPCVTTFYQLYQQHAYSFLLLCLII